MKKFTVFGMVLILAVFCSLMVYVSGAPDFTPPTKPTEPPVDVIGSWDKTMDDLLNYLSDLGLIDLSTKGPLSGGIATEAFNVSGLEVYWWDLENLSEKSDEYAAYQGMVTEGVIDLWGAGMHFMSVIQNGPFGINLKGYTGDSKAVEEAFIAFARNEGGSSGEEDMTTGVWIKSLDDLEAFLMEKGVLTADMNRISINFGMDAEGVAGYRYDDCIDLYWYDVPNLEEGNYYYEQYNSIKTSGVIVGGNGDIYEYTLNGPFALHFYYYSKNPLPEGEQQPIIDAFKEFGK